VAGGPSIATTVAGASTTFATISPRRDGLEAMNRGNDKMAASGWPVEGIMGKAT
jgi:hypothetical protein